MILIVPALLAGAAGLTAYNIRRPRKLLQCYDTRVAFENGTCPGTLANSTCYGPPKIDDGTGTCAAMSFVTVVPEYSTAYTQAPFLFPNGVSTLVNVGNTLQCKCVSSGPFVKTQNPKQAKCPVMSCEVIREYSGTLYVEIAGGKGGSITYGNDLGQSITYDGGRAGTVYGTISVSKGDQIKVDFGFDGKPATAEAIANGVQDTVPGGGGAASFLGGSNGGGASVVSLGNVKVMVAPGGGGAGRNAKGGNAGCSEPLFFQVPAKQNPNGRAGDTDAITEKTVVISGGGATTAKPGDSLDPNGTGKPFLGGSATDALASGGGGGAGYLGGGSGFTNELAKPNALHGGGGGGSCYVAPSISQSSLSGAPYIRNLVGTEIRESNYVTFGVPSV